MTFFDYDHIKIDEIKGYLLSTYKGSIKSFIEIIEEQIDETPYLVKHIRQAIKDLEKESKVNILREIETTKYGKPRVGIDNSDKIKF